MTFYFDSLTAPSPQGQPCVHSPQESRPKCTSQAPQLLLSLPATGPLQNTLTDGQAWLRPREGREDMEAGMAGEAWTPAVGPLVVPAHHKPTL